MPFQKTNQSNNELPSPPTASDGSNPSHSLKVSQSAFNQATLLVSAASTLTLFLFFKTCENWKIEDADVQSLSALIAGLSGLMIAIPLFLKDLHHGSSFWKQFFVIALVFILATAAGIFSFLRINNETIKIDIQLWFFIALGISFMVNPAALGIRGIRHKLVRMDSRLDPEFTMVLSLLALVAGTWMAPGHHLLYAFLLLSIYGLHLTILLMFAVVCQLIRNLLIPPGANLAPDLLIRQGIEKVVNDHENKAITERELINYLKNDIFHDDPRIINATNVQLLVSRMDVEMDPSQPMLSIFDHNYKNDYVIPRWSSSHQDKLTKAQPTFIALSYDKYAFPSQYQPDEVNNWNNLEKHETLLGLIYPHLVKATGLSKELLHKNDSLSQKYPALYTIYFDSPDYSQYYGLLLSSSDLSPTLGYKSKEYGPRISFADLKTLQMKVPTNHFYADDELTAALSK